MTRALPFTQASIRRAVIAARKAGLTVREIKPDGTLVVVNDGENPSSEAPVAGPGFHNARPSKWEDRRQ